MGVFAVFSFTERRNKEQSLMNIYKIVSEELWSFFKEMMLTGNARINEGSSKLQTKGQLWSGAAAAAQFQGHQHYIL